MSKQQDIAEQVEIIVFKLLGIATWIEHHKPESVPLDNEDAAYGQALLLRDLVDELKEVNAALEGVEP